MEMVQLTTRKIEFCFSAVNGADFYLAFTKTLKSYKTSKNILILCSDLYD